mgnify:CR=1 FL=1
MRSQRRFQGLLAYVLLAIMLVIALFPIYWMLVTSLKATQEIYRLVPTFWPEQLTTDGYRNLLTRTNFTNWMGNSTFVALVVALSLWSSASSPPMGWRASASVGGAGSAF